MFCPCLDFTLDLFYIVTFLFQMVIVDTSTTAEFRGVGVVVSTEFSHLRTS